MGREDTYHVLIVYDVEDWAYHFIAQDLQAYAPADFDVTISSSFKDILPEKKFDLVLFLPFTHIRQVRDYCQQTGINPAIVTAFSVGWGYANDWLEEPLKCADMVIITNHRMWDKAGRPEKTIYIPNGVNTGIFQYKVLIKSRNPKLLWTGSEFHRKIKGYDDILLPLKDRLKAYGLELDLRLVSSTGADRYSRERMAQWYNTGTIYVCSSLAEGTPLPALEAAACGCTIVSTPVGNMPELIKPGENGYLVKWDVQEFLEHVLLAVDRQERLSKHMLESIKAWSWEHKSREYYRLFEGLIDARGKEEAAR